MSCDTAVVRVVFRKDKREGDVYALMPDDVADPQGNCGCYTEHGHTAADYLGCIASSRPATPAEYAPLLEAMRRIGYTVRVAQRR
jgi:hypothetical protein